MNEQNFSDALAVGFLQTEALVKSAPIAIGAE